MPTLHEDDYRSEVQRRVRELRRDSERRWGKMSVAQMLRHVNVSMESALGKIAVPPQKSPLPRPLMKFIVIKLPWPKGAPTLPTFVSDGSYDFDAERSRCLQLIDEFAAKRLDGDWPANPLLGRMSGRDASRLHAKHLNHHLKQFGV